MMPIYAIAAMDQNRGIGYGGELAWHFSKDLSFFSQITSKTRDPKKTNLLMMGRKTFESLPPAFGGRSLLVLSQSPIETTQHILTATSIEHGFSIAFSRENIETLFIIGGADVFQQTVHHPWVKGLYLTKINACYVCDSFFPPIERASEPILIDRQEERGIWLDFFFYPFLADAQS